MALQLKFEWRFGLLSLIVRMRSQEDMAVELPCLVLEVRDANHGAVVLSR